MKILVRAASKLQVKNNTEDRNRSARVSIANNNVPVINPAWTNDDNCATVLVAFPSTTRPFTMIFPANHNEVPANCEKTSKVSRKLRFGECMP